MNAEDVVKCLINSASNGSGVSTLVISDETLVSLIVSVRALLGRIHAKSPLEQDIAAFSRLTSLPNIRLLLECRKHPPFASLDSWPHLLLFELSSFCSRLITQRKPPRSTLDRKLSRVHHHACAQVPVLWDSCIASFTRQETSPLTRVVILRLLYLGIVVHPKLSGENPTHSRLSVNTLLSHLAIQTEHLLQDSPFLPNEEAAALILGITSALNLVVFRHERNSYWLTRSRNCIMSLELLEWIYGEIGVKEDVVHSLYDWTSVAIWLFSIQDFIKYLDSSEIIVVVLSDWLQYANDQLDGWSDLVIPGLVEYPEKTLESLEGMLAFATRREAQVNRRPISLILKSLLFLASTIGTAEIASECWTRRRHQRETWLILFFLYNDEIHVQHDIVEYLFLLDRLAGRVQQDPRTAVDAAVEEVPKESKDPGWWGRAAEEAISHLRSHMNETHSDSLLAMETLISLLIYALLHFSPSAEVSQRLRGALRQLIEKIHAEHAYTVSHSLRQNALVLCSCIDWPYESPLVGSLPAHLDQVIQNQPSTEEDIFLLTQHIQLLAEASLLAKCADDLISMACYILFDELLLNIQGDMDLGSQEALAHLSSICSALICLIEAGSTPTGDFLGSSPWLFTVRLVLERGLQSTQDSGRFGESRETLHSLLVILESCASGTTILPSERVQKRQMEMKRSERGILVIFLE